MTSPPIRVVLPFTRCIVKICVFSYFSHFAMICSFRLLFPKLKNDTGIEIPGENQKKRKVMGRQTEQPPATTGSVTNCELNGQRKKKINSFPRQRTIFKTAGFYPVLVFQLSLLLSFGNDRSIQNGFCRFFSHRTAHCRPC